MRVVDGSALGLIRQWLQAPVIESGSGGEPPKVKRNGSGTPQGGVISPLLANIYLHWFDEVFHRKGSAAQKAGAVLVRYADDFVVLAQQMNDELQNFIESKIEDWLGLKINREKTRVVNLRDEGARLKFLGYRFGLDWNKYGRRCRYWNMTVSPESLLREQARLREMIGPRQCWKPLPELIGELNLHLRGWANYYSQGYPRPAFRKINRYVRERLTRHLQGRSQRPWRPSKEVSLYAHLQGYGLVNL
jgi:RNA-directed DNA polymerase